MTPEKPTDPNSPKIESGWLIEWYINSVLHFWSGRFTDRRGFSTSSADAVRFARQQDAACVIAWLLDNHGRAAEHIWTEGE